jgi:hypothetical protein
MAPYPHERPMLELPWEIWRAIIDALRANPLPYRLEHADRIEQQLDQHPANEPTATLYLTDDVYLRSFTRTSGWVLPCR